MPWDEDPSGHVVRKYVRNVLGKERHRCFQTPFCVSSKTICILLKFVLGSISMHFSNTKDLRAHIVAWLSCVFDACNCAPFARFKVSFKL